MKVSSTAALFLALAATSVSAFTPVATTQLRASAGAPLTQLFEATETVEDVAAAAVPVVVPMPQSYKEMVRQVASAMKDAAALGKEHQIIRVCLPRDASNANLGVYSEGLLDVDSNQQEIVLVPPDESWQGGIMQLYYSALPTMSDSLRLFSENESGVPPRIEEDRSIDESGVDGCSVLKSDNNDGSPISCYIQPGQETVEDYVVAQAQKPGLVVLLNPQWRVTDDWFDGVSKTNEGWFGKVAGFLGGKGDTLRRLGELDFESVYNLEGYVCRGWTVRMVKRFDSDYYVYVDDNEGSYKQVGTKAERPTYQEVEKLLDENDFGFRYTEGLI